MAYAFGLLRRAAVDLGEPPPRLLSGPEQDLMIREMIDAGDPADWPTALEPALPTRAFAEPAARPAAARVRAGHRRTRNSPRSATPTGRADWVAAARFLAEYDEVLALRDATGRAGIGYDSAEIVRAAVGTAAPRSGSAGRRAPRR